MMMQTCEKCGTSYCHTCQVDDYDEHELIENNDCIECVKMIALSLHRKVHKPVNEMKVEGAGLHEINGIYVRFGQHDGVSKFMKTSKYNGKSVEFTLFRCKLTDSTRRWYISIVPEDAHPGTTQDIDFYAVQVDPLQQNLKFPPRNDWLAIPSNGGVGPPPQVYPRYR